MSSVSRTWFFPTRLVVQAKPNPDQIYTSLNTCGYVRSGVNNPNWQQVLKADGNASSTMTVDIDEPYVISPSSAVLHYVTKTQDGPQIGDHKTLGTRPPPLGFSYPNTLTDWEEDVRIKASQGFLRRLKEQDHRFQGGVFFGEIVPTLKMLKRPFGSLRDGLIDYSRVVKRRGRGKSGRPLKKILGDTWLEYAFGWQPLLADIQDASAAAISIYASLRRSRINQVASDSYSEPTQIVRDYVENLMTYQIYFTNEVSYSVKYYGGLEPLPNAKAGLSSLGRLADMSSFDLMSFVPTAWELIPYSFLVDYFSNVGKVLDAYFTDTSVLRWMSMVERRTSGKQIRWDYDHAKTLRYIEGAPGGPSDKSTETSTSGAGSTYGNRHINILRWSHGSLTYSGLRFQLPFSGKQFMNMTALLAGMKSLPR